MKKGSIRENLAWSMILTGVNYLFPLVVYMHVSRALGVTGVGLVGFIDSVATFFILVSMMGISSLGLREIARTRHDRQKLSDTFWSLLTLQGIFTVFVLALMVTATISVPELRSQWQLMGIGMCKLLFNVFLIEWFFVGMEEFRFITLRTLSVKALYVAAIFIFVSDDGDIFVYYLLTMLVVLGIAAVGMTQAVRMVSLRDVALTLRRFLKPFFALGLYEITSSTFFMLCLAWLGFAADDRETGYFSTSSRVILLVTGLFTVVTQVMSARAGRLLSEGEIACYRRQSQKSLLWLGLSGVGLVVLLYLFAPLAVRLLSGDGFEGSVEPLQAMAVALPIVAVGRVVAKQLMIPRGMDREVALGSLAGFLGCISIFVLAYIFPDEKTTAMLAALAWIAAEAITLAVTVALYRNKI